jgi:hypothetical protein
MTKVYNNLFIFISSLAINIITGLRKQFSEIVFFTRTRSEAVLRVQWREAENTHESGHSLLERQSCHTVET